MKSPRPIGAPIDMARMRGWLNDFSGYRHAITELRIERWLSQFDLPDIDLAARLLDCVDFVTNEQIATAFRTSLNSIEGWHQDPSRRVGTWRFCAFSASAGESGDAMLHKFRHANNLASRKHDALFVHRSELLTSGLGDGDRIVFIDDFAGTGTQVCDAWPMFLELVPEGPALHLLLIGATKDALARMREDTDLVVDATVLLADGDGLFHRSCRHFSPAEKDTVGRYCRRAGTLTAAQYSKCGNVIVFAHACPNNSLPILHASRGVWEGLFRRYD